MSEYADLFNEIEGLKSQVRNLSTRARVGNPVYGGPVNADIAQSAKTSGPFMWIVDAGHSLEVVLPVQTYVHRILDAKLRVTFRPVRVGSAVGGAPNVITTNDSSVASSRSTAADNAQASSVTTTIDDSTASNKVTADDNAQASSRSTVVNNSQSSSAATTDATGSTINVESAGHVHKVFLVQSSTPGVAGNWLYAGYDSVGSQSGTLNLAIVSSAADRYTAISAASPTAVPTSAHTHGMAHTHSHDHDMTHTHNHGHGMDHTHSHVHTMAHTHNHGHDMTHTHSHTHTLDHVHTTTIGSSLTEGGSPAGVRLYLDTGAGYTELTSALAGPWDASFEVQLARYFNDTLQPRQPIIGNHKLLLTSTSIGTLEVNMDWYQMLKPVTSA